MRGWEAKHIQPQWSMPGFGRASGAHHEAGSAADWSAVWTRDYNDDARPPAASENQPDAR